MITHKNKFFNILINRGLRTPKNLNVRVRTYTRVILYIIYYYYIIYYLLLLYYIINKKYIKEEGIREEKENEIYLIFLCAYAHP